MISCASESSSFLSLICLTATVSPENVFRPRKTEPKAPRPKLSPKLFLMLDASYVSWGWYVLLMICDLNRPRYCHFRSPYLESGNATESSFIPWACTKLYTCILCGTSARPSSVPIEHNPVSDIMPHTARIGCRF